MYLLTMDFGDKYYWRQVFVMLGIWFQAMSGGVIMAFPTVMTATTNTTGIQISAEHASWLASSLGISGILGCVILSFVMQMYGRRPVHVLLCALHLVSWFIFYNANSLFWLYVGRLVQGLSFGIVYINAIIVSEYTRPTCRGYFNTILKVFMATGFLICHCLSFWTWREPAAAGAGIAFLATVLTMCWPESPSYYAMKGRFEECKKAFTWLHGSSIEKKKELAALISGQMETLQPKILGKNDGFIMLFFKPFLERDFQKAMIMGLLVTLALDTCGRYYVVAYIKLIMIELVGKEHAVYYAMAVDLLTITALIISCFLVRYLKRRTILFLFGFISAALMFSVAIALYFKERSEVVSYLVWLTPLLLVLQSFVTNFSVIPISFTLLGEVFPLQYKSLGSFLTGVSFCVFYGITLKITPIMIRDLGVGGTYATYGTCLTVILILMYFTVPETKDKTLQEIEDELKGVQRTVDDDVLRKLNAETETE